MKQAPFFFPRPLRLALLIDAENMSWTCMDMMEMLHAPQRKVDGFCIVSSDSDYTGVVTRAREADVPVYGFGRQDAATSFVAACNAFVFLDSAYS